MDVLEDKKYDALIRAGKIKKEELINIGQTKGYMGVYTAGLENMYDYLMKNNITMEHGHWILLKNCSNEGIYCSVCYKKVYKTNYANQKIKSRFCPNCGSIMDNKMGVL